MLASQVLILNRSYLPVHVTTVRRAFNLLYQGHAKVVGEEYEIFDFHNWLNQKVEQFHDWIGLVNQTVRVPRVLVLSLYDRMPQKQIRFSRQNVFLRDRNTCQYCGIPNEKHQLNLDHVIPRSRGGKTSWENVVCCCLKCNHQKGYNLPHEISMSLIKRPVKPRWVPYLDLSGRFTTYQEWEPFLKVLAS